MGQTMATKSKFLRAFDDQHVKAIFDAYPNALRADLLQLRELIFDTADNTEGVGELVETTKWGQPAYLPVPPKTGSTIRIDVVKNQPNRYAMFFHCQTRLIATFRELYCDQFVFQENRAILFNRGEPIAQEPLRHCIALSLTYHSKLRGAGAKLTPS